MFSDRRFHSLENILDYSKEVGLVGDVVLIRVAKIYATHRDDYILNNPRGEVPIERYELMIERHAFKMTYRDLEKIRKENKADGAR